MSTAIKSVYTVANSGRHLFYLVFGTWLVAALIFWLIEPVSIVDSLYWSMTTLSTVGYGDLSPASVLGKFFTIAFQAWSIFFVVPNAVAYVVDKVRRDEHKFTHAEQEWTQKNWEALDRHLNLGLDSAPSDTDFEEK